MIQYYLDLEKQVKNIKEKSLSQGQIQKLYSTAYYISLSIRAPGKTWHLYFGRGGGFEGIWLHESPPPSILRRKDNFLEYLRRHLSSCSFLDVTLDRFDRIAKLTYQKFGKQQSFLWFWKGRKLYFLHHYMERPETPFKVLLSWRNKSFFPEGEDTNLFEYFDEIGRRQDMNHDLVSPDVPGMDILLAEELKVAELKDVTSVPTFLQRKKENIQADLRKAEQWHKLQALLDKQHPLESVYELKVDDQKIKFVGELNPYERRNLVFEKIKKLKRGENILQQRLAQVEEQLMGKEVVKARESKIPMVRPIWGEDTKTTIVQPQNTTENYRVFIMEDCQIGVGLNAQGNDQLRSRWANKEDHWIHLEGLKSTHVIIKLTSARSISSELLNLGATIVAHFSHFKDDWIPIIYTQVKNLKGVSGAPGMVIYKKEKHLRCPKTNVDDLFKD